MRRGAPIVLALVWGLLPALAEGHGPRQRGNEKAAGQVQSFKTQLLSHRATQKTFGVAVEGAYWMNQRVNKMGNKLRAAQKKQKKPSLQDQPIQASPTAVLYGDDIFRNAFFNSKALRGARRASSVKRQPWLEWVAQEQRYLFHAEGGSERILSRLGNRLSLHRGASALEASLWQGVKGYTSGKLKPEQRERLEQTLSAIGEQWELRKTSEKRLATLRRTLQRKKLPKKSVRKTHALFLLGLISERIDDLVGYGAVMTTPSLKSAKEWAKGTATGMIWGRKKQKAAVISFDLDIKKAPAKARAGLFAGVEGGAIESAPTYVEVGFLSADAKLWALEGLKTSE